MTQDDHQTISYHRTEHGNYVLDAPIVYYSPRYRKTVTCPEGMVSDGASGPAEDVASLSWWVHDRVCTTFEWDDHTECPPWEGSTILHDILLAEGRWFRARSWWLATIIAQTWVYKWKSH